MTPTWFKRTAYGLIGLSLLCLVSVQWTSKGTAAATQPPAPTPAQSPTPAPTPTLARYNCGDPDHPDYISFTWTKRMPQGGWLGTVSYGKIISKPVQAFNAAKINDDARMLDWTFQAQDGSFLCHMYVTTKPSDRSVSFGACRNNNWPQVTCSLP